VRGERVQEEEEGEGEEEEGEMEREVVVLLPYGCLRRLDFA